MPNSSWTWSGSRALTSGNASRRGRGQVFLAELHAVERDQLGLIVDDRGKVDRPLPDAVQVAQRVPRLLEVQVHPLVPVLKEQLRPVPEVAVGDQQDRMAHVGQPKEEALLDRLEVAVGDLVAVGLRVVLVDEELVLDA